MINVVDATVVEAEREGIVIASVRNVERAVQRTNLMLGFKQKSKSAPRKYLFTPGYGFIWNVLKCVNFEDVREQFRLLSAYAHRRFRMLAGGVRGHWMSCGSSANMRG